MSIATEPDKEFQLRVTIDPDMDGMYRWLRGKNKRVRQRELLVLARLGFALYSGQTPAQASVAQSAAVAPPAAALPPPAAARSSENEARQRDVGFANELGLDFFMPPSPAHAH